HFFDLESGEHTPRFAERPNRLGGQTVDAFDKRLVVLELNHGARLNVGRTRFAKVPNKLPTRARILEQPVPEFVQTLERIARRIAELEDEVSFMGDGKTAGTDDTQHLPNDPDRVRHVNQQVPAEDDVERRVLKGQLRGVTLLKLDASRVIGTRVSVLDQSR